VQQLPEEAEMPKFVDHHPTNPNLPPELLTVIRQRLLGGERDEFGDRGINVFIGPRETYCYTEAPSAEAVRDAHAALGIFLPVDDVQEVHALP
jgi:hypothetical protein